LNADLHIRQENKAAALGAVRGLMDPLPRTRKGWDDHYPFVDTATVEAAETLEDCLKAWRWSVIDENEDEDIIEVGFTGEKYGAEDLLFETLAPFVEAGSVIQMAGDDGVIWRWRFDGGNVRKDFGRIVFDELAQQTVTA
jgi:hypothetical protein